MAFQIVKIPGSDIQMPSWGSLPVKPQGPPPPDYHIDEAIMAFGKVLNHFSPEEREKRAMEKDKMDFDRDRMAQERASWPMEQTRAQQAMDQSRESFGMSKERFGMEKSAFEAKAQADSDFTSTFNPPQSKTVGGQRVIKQYREPTLPPNPFNRPDFKADLSIDNKPLSSSEVIWSGNKMGPLIGEADTPPEWLYSPETLRSLSGYNSMMG